MKIIVAGVLLAGLVPTQSQASDFKPWRSVGGWEVSRNSEDQECQIASSFEGEGSTLVMLNYIPSTDTARFFVGNKGWLSLKEGDNPKVTIDFGAAGTWNDVKTLSIAPDDYHWIIMKLDGLDFITDFAVAPRIIIKMGSTIVEKLNLSGTNAAVLALIECGGTLNKGIARDPFSNK